MKTCWFIVVGLAALAAGSPTAFADAQAVDGFAAAVNSRIITIGDVLDLIQPADDQLKITYTGAELDARRREAFTNGLATLIERALIVEEFKAQGGTLPDRYVNDRLAEFIQERFQGDRSAFLEALGEQQITLEDWRDQLRDRLIVNILRRQEVQDHVRISPTSVRTAYDAHMDKYRTEEKVHLRMILLNRGTTDSENHVKRDEADKLLARLRAGEDFAAVAKEASEGGKAADGGDMGWVQPGDLRAELRTAMAALKPGAISDVIESGNEFYIVKLEEHRDAGVVPFEQVRPAIESDLRDAEAARLYKAWTDRLRRKFYVEMFDNGT